MTIPQGTPGSFGGVPPQVVVRPHVRALVEFRRHNLVSDPAPATFLDLILCRNVLIYFNPPTAARVVEKLLVSLAPGGVLVLGPVEAPFAAGRDLERLEEDGATIFRAFTAHADSQFFQALRLQFEHVAWEGFRFYDFIFPLFIFVTGVSIPVDGGYLTDNI